ncbi:MULTISPECIES: 1-phosphofructokinase family hexose kinase [Streptacidiphilus]|uniref:1-phosphofructokinase family hexose kinase n=1 Tax=Streptacidiphilus cavernicola TaxID=3342716 RepID=A0ABV6UI80_9ACTN|nr:1-phosphofructokinase family hexose kinase [Streptacidiphilus jeojiense]
MIVTLTPNPSLDRTLEVPDLHRGVVLRATARRTDPGGKGVNVSRALAANGRKTVAVLPCGGIVGSRLAELLAPQGVEVLAVPVLGEIRVNISVVEPDGTVTKINEPGPVLTPQELDALAEAAVRAGQGAAWVALSGSLPPGAPDDLYARLITRIREAGGPLIAVDSSGVPLVAALAAGPDLVKPNRAELAEASGLPVTTLGEAVTAALALRDRGARTVLASLGADGALLVDGSGAVHGRARVAEPRSAVGAGDALLAGYLSAGNGGTEALAEAVAWGAAATSLPGSRMPGREHLDRAGVHLDPNFDPNHPLTERN